MDEQEYDLTVAANVDGQFKREVERGSILHSMNLNVHMGNLGLQ